MSSPLPLCSVAISFFLSLCSRTDTGPTKNPLADGAGGCERTLCGVRRQVSSRVVVETHVMVTSIVPSLGGTVKGSPSRAGRPEPNDVAVGIGMRRLPDSETGIEE